MESSRRCLRLVAIVFAFLAVLFLVGSVSAQGLMPGVGLDLAPSNPFGLPGTTGGLPRGSDSIYLNSGMFRDILPLKGNLEFGFLYQFNENISTSRFTFDGLLPARTGHDGAAFGEFHGEFVNFCNTLRSLITFGNTTTSQRGVKDRIDLSFGGGYRKIFGESLLVGVNGFYDASKLWNRWYGSAGVGVEMAALGAGSDLIDLNFNYYGNLFQGRNSIVNAWRNGPGNFDVEVGYSLELGDHGPDLRLKLTGYQFDVGAKIYGWNGGAEITSRNGVFSVKAETGRDRINGTYYTVGGYANVGLQLENLLKGVSPFTMPEPIFQSPRNLRRLLGVKVKRNWHQPEAVILAASIRNPAPPCVLSGYVLLAQTIVIGPIYNTTPAIPNLAPYNTVTICWCGALQDYKSVALRIADGVNQYVDLYPFDISSGSGCATKSGSFTGTVSTNGVTLQYAGPSPLLFDTGGGMSFVFSYTP